MTILLINGSVRQESTNQRLLQYIAQSFMQYDIVDFSLDTLPLFHPDFSAKVSPAAVHHFKSVTMQADAVIISTPEYLHNIPASLKNALEWLTTDGEFNNKAILAITYTPHAPRGHKAMQSLLHSLQALNANILTSVELFHTDIAFDKNGLIVNNKGATIVDAAVEFLLEYIRK